MERKRSKVAEEEGFAVVGSPRSRKRDEGKTPVCKESEHGAQYEGAEKDLLIYLLHYKTERCLRKPCSRNCHKFHSLKERRRSPLLYQYSEQPCAAVKVGSESGKTWGDPARCPLGDACAFSHTLVEQMYHPKIYKTGLCNKFDPNSKSPEETCAWGPLCTHAHGAADKERLAKSLARFQELREICACEETSPVNTTTTLTSSKSVPDMDLSSLRASSSPLHGTVRTSSTSSVIARPSLFSGSRLSISIQPEMTSPTTSWSPLKSSIDWAISSSPLSTSPRLGHSTPSVSSGPLSSLDDEILRSREISPKKTFEKISVAMICTACGSSAAVGWTALIPCGHALCAACADDSISSAACCHCGDMCRSRVVIRLE